jgi:hypothetical protein
VAAGKGKFNSPTFANGRQMWGTVKTSGPPAMGHPATNKLHINHANVAPGYRYQFTSKLVSAFLLDNRRSLDSYLPASALVKS